MLLHAGVADRRMWAPIVPALARGHRVITVDLRGFGETPLPGESYADADDVAHLMSVLGIEAAAVVGSSFGGRVSLELATRHTERVTSLATLCGALREVEVTDPEVLAFGEREDALLEAGDIEGAVRLNVDTWLGPEADQATRDLVTRMQRRAFGVQATADALDPGPEPERVAVDLSRVMVPTLVVSGGHDVAHFRTVAAHLASSIDGADHITLDWAGHLPSLERPDVVAALLESHLHGGPVRTVV